MGKKRIARLLDQLRDNQEQDIQNAASIFSVAQVAVNELERQSTEDDNVSGGQREGAIALLPPEPPPLDKTELLRRYGSYNGCRKAAKAEGITFHKNPTWNQLIAGFSYAESIRLVVKQYLATHPNPVLNEITISVRLEAM
jgi:hypothetical protein